jgi:hypothetical protein
MFRERISVVIERKPYAFELFDEPSVRRHSQVVLLRRNIGIEEADETRQDGTRQDK